jgi:N-acetylglucosamine kinase-like BadF-type ATPase
MKSVLDPYFETNNTEVYSDLLGAARSLCREEEGIACILGTGSNSCYYDGENIAENVPPLGFILGDEGSGAVMGKKLLADVLKKQLSRPLLIEFQTKYNLSSAAILDHVYRQPFPNRFLSQFMPFIAENSGYAEIKNLVENSFSEFITRNIFQYVKAQQVPIHFTGSIAWHFREILENTLRKHRLQLGKVEKEPLNGLVEYHLNKAKS